MQTALHIAEQDTPRERYKYNIEKTKTIGVNTKSSPDLKLHKPLGVSDTEAHLGIYRNHNNIYRPVASEEDCQSVQRGLEALEEWEQEWETSFNRSKCSVIHVTK